MSLSGRVSVHLLENKGMVLRSFSYRADFIWLSWALETFHFQDASYILFSCRQMNFMKCDRSIDYLRETMDFQRHYFLTYEMKHVSLGHCPDPWRLTRRQGRPLEAPSLPIEWLFDIHRATQESRPRAVSINCIIIKQRVPTKHAITFPLSIHASRYCPDLPLQSVRHVMGTFFLLQFMQGPPFRDSLTSLLLPVLGV